MGCRYQGDGKHRRILRTVYECGVFQALREKLNDALGGQGLAWLKIAERRNAGAIRLTPLDAAPEPRYLRRLKTAICLPGGAWSR